MLLRVSVCVLAAVFEACGQQAGVSALGGPDGAPPSEVSTPDAGGAGSTVSTTDAGMMPDAGTMPDAGAHDAGSASDGGTMPDAGAHDAGSASDAGSAANPPPPPPPPAPIPSVQGWTFYGPQDGLPASIFGVSADQGGNLWVAGGEDGLFLLRAGESRFVRFTMADGLRPFGYMPDGSAPPGTPYLKVISVIGAQSGTAFVGYAGKPPGPGELGCEDNWDGPNPDPSIYKSGDADRVTLSGGGLRVVHYDIFSGPDVISAEKRGREKLCDVYRMAWDPARDAIWFGANHGFAWGRASFAGNPTCNGQFGCAGVWEHVHPAFNGFINETDQTLAYYTGDYYGVAVDPVTKDVWFGGVHRTTKFRFGTDSGDYFKAESETEDPPYVANRLDVWPDKVPECPGDCPSGLYPRPSDRIPDLVSGIAALPDGTAWVGSFAFGLARLAADGTVMGYLKSELVSANVSAVAYDPSDGSLWAGANWGGGLSRIVNGAVVRYDWHVFGDLANSAVPDIQLEGSGGSRRVLVAFAGTSTMGAVVAIYSGR